MMAIPPPIKTPCFIKYLNMKGCVQGKGTNHKKWKYPGGFRSIIFDRNDKEIPYIHVKNNLKIMGSTMAGFKKWAKMNC